MKHLLSISTTFLGDITPTLADTNLGPSPQTWIPASIEGRLLGLSERELCELASGCDVEVYFEGRPYRFVSWGKDGAFELSIVRQPLALAGVLEWSKLFTSSSALD